MKKEYLYYNGNDEVIGSTYSNDVYIDYVTYDHQDKPLNDEEILERMNVETIERFLRKKKIKNIEKQ